MMVTNHLLFRMIFQVPTKNSESQLVQFKFKLVKLHFDDTWYHKIGPGKPVSRWGEFGGFYKWPETRDFFAQELVLCSSLRTV